MICDSDGYCGTSAGLCDQSRYNNIFDKSEDYGFLNLLAPYYMVPVILGTRQLEGLNTPFIKELDALK